MSSIIARDFYGDDHPFDRNERARLRIDELERVAVPPEVLDTRYFRRDVDQIRPGPGDLLTDLMGIPGLRALWSFASHNESLAVPDYSNQARTLTAFNTPTFGYDDELYYAYARLASGSSQYFSRSDEAGLDITGALTVMGWIRFTTVPASIMGILSKYIQIGNLRAYQFIKDASNKIVIEVSPDGSATSWVASNRAVVADVPYFVAGRFIPSTSLSVWLGSTPGGLEKTIATASIPASIFNTTAALNLGRTNNTSYMNGDLIGAMGLYAGDVPDGAVERHFDKFRSVIGV